MLGVLYASVVARFLYFRILWKSKHRYSHTLVGWSVWIAVLFGVWIFAFIISGIIPFFNGIRRIERDLTIRSIELDIFTLQFLLRIYLLGIGISSVEQKSALDFSVEIDSHCDQLYVYCGGYFLFEYCPLFAHRLMEAAGTYASVQSIIDDYAVGAISTVFSCADNGL